MCKPVLSQQNQKIIWISRGFDMRLYNDMIVIVPVLSVGYGMQWGMACNISCRQSGQTVGTRHHLSLYSVVSMESRNK